MVNEVVNCDTLLYGPRLPIHACVPLILFMPHGTRGRARREASCSAFAVATPASGRSKTASRERLRSRGALTSAQKLCKMERHGSWASARVPSPRFSPRILNAPHTRPGLVTSSRPLRAVLPDDPGGAQDNPGSVGHERIHECLYCLGGLERGSSILPARPSAFRTVGRESRAPEKRSRVSPNGSESAEPQRYDCRGGPGE